MLALMSRYPQLEKRLQVIANLLKMQEGPLKASLHCRRVCGFPHTGTVFSKSKLRGWGSYGLQSGWFDYPVIPATMAIVMGLFQWSLDLMCSGPPSGGPLAVIYMAES